MSWLGGEPAGTQRWVWDGPMGRLQGTFQLPLAHPALPYPPWGVSGLQAMLPYPQCFLKKQNIPVHLHCCFALKGGKKKKIFFFFSRQICFHFQPTFDHAIMMFSWEKRIPKRPQQHDSDFQLVQVSPAPQGLALCCTEGRFSPARLCGVFTPLHLLLKPVAALPPGPTGLRLNGVEQKKNPMEIERKS